MDPDKPDNFQIADVVVSTAGHDRGELFYVEISFPATLVSERRTI